MASVRQLTTTNREGKRPWVVEYTDAAGKRRRATPPSGLKKDADKLRQQIERELNDGAHVATGDTKTVRDVCDEFLKVVDARRKEKSISHGRSMHFRITFDRHLIPVLGAKKLSELRIEDAEALYDRMTKTTLAPATARHYIGACISMERFGKKRKYTHRDVFADFMRERPRGERERIRTFTIDEVRALLATAAVRPPLYRIRAHAFLNCVVNLAAFCGLRRGEIFGLTAANIDFDNGYIRVRHSLDRTDTLKGPKTKAGLRDVPMPRHVADLLEAWIATHAVPDRRNLIFRTPDGFTFGGGNFNERWQDLLKRCSFDREDEEGRTFHFHALRHFAASYMIECGWALPEVAALLGHSTFDMTLQTYAHAVAGGRQRSDRMQALASRLLTSADVPALLMAPTDATETRQAPLSI